MYDLLLLGLNLVGIVGTALALRVTYRRFNLHARGDLTLVLIAMIAITQSYSHLRPWMNTAYSPFLIPLVEELVKLGFVIALGRRRWERFALFGASFGVMEYGLRITGRLVFDYGFTLEGLGHPGVYLGTVVMHTATAAILSVVVWRPWYFAPIVFGLSFGLHLTFNRVRTFAMSEVPTEQYFLGVSFLELLVIVVILAAVGSKLSRLQHVEKWRERASPARGWELGIAESNHRRTRRSSNPTG